MKKPLSITSPDHAVALANYFILGFAGMLFVINKEAGGSRLIERVAGLGVADVWATTLMIFGFMAFVSALSARRARRPENSIRFEMYACIGLFLNLGFFTGIILAGSASAITTMSFAATFAVGAGFRVVQIFVEQRRVKLARRHPVESDSVLADPREEHGH